MDGWIALAIASLISLGAFFNGLRFARMTTNPWTGRSFLGFPIEGGDLTVERVQWIGRLQMICAPMFWLVFAALCFGLLGPVQGIETVPARVTAQ